MSNSSSALFGACEAGDVIAVQRIITDGESDVDGNSRWGHIDPRGWQRSPLHVAIQYGHLQLAQWLLENGADPNAQTKYGDTPLNAVLAPPLPPHYLDAVRLLMAHGADPALPNDEAETPLTHAQRTGAVWNTVRPLLERAASNRNGPIDPNQRFAVIQSEADGRNTCYVTVASPEGMPDAGLPSDLIVGELSEMPQSSAIDPVTFAPNERFVHLLHDVVARRGPEQPALQREAHRLSKGHVFVIDQRTATPQGPVPPEDILGYFAVAQRSVVTGSYRANPNYRLMTERGLFQLHPELHAALVAELISRS